jgi:hypothetical protein
VAGAAAGAGAGGWVPLRAVVRRNVWDPLRTDLMDVVTLPVRVAPGPPARIPIFWHAPARTTGWWWPGEQIRVAVDRPTGIDPIPIRDDAVLPTPIAVAGPRIDNDAVTAAQRWAEGVILREGRLVVGWSDGYDPYGEEAYVPVLAEPLPVAEPEEETVEADAYAHVILDEAQDLSPMECRMIARREGRRAALRRRRPPRRGCRRRRG